MGSQGWPPVRVLLANPYFLPHLGGIEARLHGLAKGLAARHEVAVLTSQLPGTAPEERRDGFTVLRCPARVWRTFPYNPPPSWTSGIGDALAGFDADVVDLQYRWAPEWTRALAAWAKRAPLVVTWHNAFGEGLGLVRALSRANDRRFLRHMGEARQFLCISDAVRRDLAREGVPAARMSVAYPGFDAPPPLRMPEGDHAVFVGRLVATKGLDVLLDALPAAPDVKVVLVGMGPQAKALQARARRRGVADRVRFTGFVPEEEKQALMASARFVVHPARWESLGHALAEAMLHGKPVLASDVGGVPELVGPGGILVPAGDPRALAEGMQRLWGDAPLREALGSKAREHVARFTWERCVADTERAYQQALTSPALRLPSPP